MITSTHDAILQKLIEHHPRSKRSRIRQLARALTFVAEGIKPSQLIDDGSVAPVPLAQALESLEAQDGASGLRVWIHGPSGSFGVLNVAAVARLACPPPCVMDASSNSPAGTILHPSSAIESLKCIQLLSEACRRSTAILSGHVLSLSGRAPSAGVALAGWLLDYPVVYALKSDSTGFDCRLDVQHYRRYKESEAQWEEGAVGNNLGGSPLCCFEVFIRRDEEGTAEQERLQSFTVPQVALKDPITYRSAALHKISAPYIGGSGQGRPLPLAGQR
ncbi:hypothetical protein IE81DRAFT_348762 [Ceraceosorus guamensis]|uniref:Uncharacterized protein n=1 Tax=Ceraceosorus guamensis TaxID=1522189 RepID=A0A316VTP8_9BASI|nr:hypothetical protein IE81DRAFT_348762 [Ceraceosorus guamensis]PWN40976.1 hypothetical protein IE81DRAFT_348762 [Ceraceosorus guamensis]